VTNCSNGISTAVYRSSNAYKLYDPVNRNIVTSIDVFFMRDSHMGIHHNGKVKFCTLIMKSLNSKLLSHIGGTKETRTKK
jgi:hypothetical protein